jgi:hypothetical protein
MLFAFGAPVFGQQSAAPAAAEALGYVVRVESGAVYLDFTEKTGAHAGQPFTVYTEGVELLHPITKASLGRIATTVAEGALTLVLPTYSVGSLRGGSPEVSAGMRARLGTAPKAAAPAAAPTLGLNAKDAVPARAARVKGPTLDYKITGMAIADFRGDGKMTAAVSDTKTVNLYPYPLKDSQPLAQFVLPGVGPRIVSLTAADLDGDGRSELFVTLYNETFTRMETVVLEWTDGQWKQVADLPWMVRSFQDGAGKPVLAMQQLVEDETFPYSSIYPVVLKDGQYARGAQAIRFKRIDFLYDFTQADLGGGKDPALLYETSTNHIRVQFKDGFWKTPESYGQTPTRLRWHSHLLEFHPQMPIGSENGKTAVYLIKNNSMLGSLSEPFGLFNGGLIERQEWNGVALETLWRADLGGYCTAAQLVPGPKNAADLAVAVTGTAGKSSIWVFDP